jgi:hypothetical protein
MRVNCSPGTCMRRETRQTSAMAGSFHVTPNIQVEFKLLDLPALVPT